LEECVLAVLLCINTGFLLLFIYAMINMNIVSWGTREVTQADDVDVDIANRVKQPNAWRSFIHEVQRIGIWEQPALARVGGLA